MDVVNVRNDELAQTLRANQNCYWWQGPIIELSMEHLEQLKIAYKEVDKTVQIQAQKGLPSNANTFCNFKISEPSEPNNVVLVKNEAPFTANQGPSGSGAANLAFPFDDPNAQGPFRFRAAFPFGDSKYTWLVAMRSF
ncbi:OLC1v1012418C1 [Oldenlandia corymbosa var. corymbosa]|uniref:OLC1v1012418C1 n=1 Tax=Oldenlandia corymbosa var. corymbosa TaxID=529605 RepID=A0AAV1DW41_OLDCO|nr:OLC1v1012418C1 [Oldenlandia corymbosa var. corymbosa]